MATLLHLQNIQRHFKALQDSSAAMVQELDQLLSANAPNAPSTGLRGSKSSKASLPRHASTRSVESQLSHIETILKRDFEHFQKLQTVVSDLRNGSTTTISTLEPYQPSASGTPATQQSRETDNTPPTAQNPPPRTAQLALLSEAAEEEADDVLPTAQTLPPRTSPSRLSSEAAAEEADDASPTAQLEAEEEIDRRRYQLRVRRTRDDTVDEGDEDTSQEADKETDDSRPVILPTVQPGTVSELRNNLPQLVADRTKDSQLAKIYGGCIIPIEGLPTWSNATTVEVLQAINNEIANQSAHFYGFEISTEKAGYNSAPNGAIYASDAGGVCKPSFTNKLVLTGSFGGQTVQDLTAWWNKTISDLKAWAVFSQEPRRTLQYYIDELELPTSDYLEQVYALLRPAGAAITPSNTSDIPGITTPYLYYSNDDTTPAPLHVEDAGLGSVNILLAGAPKVWILVPPTAQHRFEEMLQRLYPQCKLSCSQSVRHISAVLSPSILEQHKIPFAIVQQMVGDMIVTLPNSYHQVLNQGPNAAVAINFKAIGASGLPPTYRWCTSQCGGNPEIRSALEGKHKPQAKPRVKKTPIRSKRVATRSASKPASYPSFYPTLLPRGTLQECLEYQILICNTFTPWWIPGNYPNLEAFASLREEGEFTPEFCAGMLRLVAKSTACECWLLPKLSDYPEWFELSKEALETGGSRGLILLCEDDNVGFVLLERQSGGELRTWHCVSAEVESELGGLCVDLDPIRVPQGSVPDGTLGEVCTAPTLLVIYTKHSTNM